MKKITFVTILFFIFISSLSLNAQWARTYGGSNSDLAWSIQQTSDGGYVVAGSTSSFGAGMEDIWILKLSSTGIIEWQRTYGGSNSDVARSIQQTSDGSFIVAGYTESFGAGMEDIYILKLSSTGGIEWQRTYGGDSYDWSYCIQQTSDGGFIVAGYTGSFEDIADFWILKLSSTGGIEWQRTYGADIDVASCIQQTSDGGYIVAGYTYWPGGEPDIWIQDIRILKLTSNGAIEWQKSYEASGEDEPFSIQQTSDGGFIVAGYTYPVGAACDAWILKLSSTGGIEWQRTYGGSYIDSARSIQQTSDGGYIVAGSTSSFSAGNRVWILKLSSTGGIEWQRTYGGGWASCIQQTSDGGYVVAGRTSFGAGDGDLIVLKLFSDGAIDETCGFIGTSDSTITDTSAIPVDSGMPLGVPAAEYEYIYIFPQDTYATANLLCGVQGYELTISATTGGTTSPSPDTHFYDEGIEVSITATPESGYRFKEWTGDIPSGHENDNPITITMDSDKSVNANFIRQCTLTIAAGSGGSTDPMPDTYTFDQGEQVTITAIPGNGFRFVSWSGDVSSTENPIIISMDGNKSITANFIKQYTLTIVADTGGTTIPAPGTYSHDSGAQENITAMPDNGYRFSEWTGDVPSGHENDNPITITMDSDKSVTANFVRQYTLTIAAGSGGTTNPVPGTYSHDSGAQVSIQAIHESGYQFSSWSGDASGMTNPVTITMDSDKSITAHFSAIPNGDGDEDGAGGGTCFIATATYGSPSHPHVDILRDFRDKYLMSNKFGRAFVDLYYEYSPHLSNIITKHKLLRVIVQINLTPFVVLSYSMVHLGPIITSGVLLCILVLPIFFMSNPRKK